MRKPTQTHREHETPHRKALGMIKTQTLSCCVTKALFTEPPCRLHLLRESLRKSMIHCSDIWSISVIFQTARLNTSSFFSTKMFLFLVGHFSNQGKHLGELFLQCGGKKTLNIQTFQTFWCYQHNNENVSLELSIHGNITSSFQSPHISARRKTRSNSSLTCVNNEPFGTTQ